MKIYKLEYFYLFPLLSLLLILDNCGHPPQKNTTRLELTLSAATLTSVPGGVMLYGQNADRSQHFSVPLSATERFTQVLPNGVWNFAVVGWNGPGVLEGDVLCALKTQELRGGEVVVTLSLAIGGCKESFFGTSAFHNGQQFYPLKIHSCRSLAALSAANQNCELGNRGGAASMRIQLMQQPLTLYPYLQQARAALTSTCLSFYSNSVKSTAKATQIKIPQGQSQSAFPLEMIFYDGDNCTGNSEKFRTINLTTLHNQYKTFAASGTTYNQVFVKSNLALSPSDLASLTVDSLYPVNGGDWNDYVKNDGGNFYSASDTACTGAETGTLPCLHGGMLKKIVLTGIESCLNLQMSDSLGVFHWSCKVIGGQATFFLDGFQDGKSLRHLLTSAAWIPNAVTLTKGSVSKTSAATAWWNNPITAVSTVGESGYVAQNLAVANSIYVLDTSSETQQGFNLNADHIAFVTLPGVTLRGKAALTTNNCDQTTGESGANRICMLSAGTQKFLWVEAKIDGAVLANHGILFNNISMSRIHATQVYNTHNANTYPGYGVFLLNSNSNQLTHLSTINTNSHGINLTTSSSNVLKSLKSSNNGGSGLLLSTNARLNTVVDGLFTANAGNGISLEDSGAGGTQTSANSLVNITAAQNSGYGIYVDGSFVKEINFLRVVATNNTLTGIKLYNSPTLFTFFNTASVANGQYGIIQNASYVNYYGNVLLGSNFTGNCSISSTTARGMNDASCSSRDFSQFSLSTGIGLTGNFKSKLSGYDAVNTGDDGGVDASHPGGVAFDWTHFANAYRQWGKQDPDPFPDLGASGRWVAATLGNIWDWSLMKGSSYALINKSVSASSPNDDYVAGLTCPSALNGNVTLTDQLTTPNTFLKHAFEEVEDMVGDNDGLCESNETCQYAPNFGAYQGHGTTQAQECLFNSAGGPVTNVSMSSLSINGY